MLLKNIKIIFYFIISNFYVKQTIIIYNNL